MNTNDLAQLAAQKAAAAQQMQQQQAIYQNVCQTIEEESPDLKTPTAEDIGPLLGSQQQQHQQLQAQQQPQFQQPQQQQKLSAAVGGTNDGGSSTSESSLGSSSGYGSQSTVRLEEQQQQQQNQQQQQQQSMTEGRMALELSSLFCAFHVEQFETLSFSLTSAEKNRSFRKRSSKSLKLTVLSPTCFSFSGLSLRRFHTHASLHCFSPSRLLLPFPKNIKATGRLVSKYVPFLAPIRLLANLHRGIYNKDECSLVLVRKKTLGMS